MAEAEAGDIEVVHDEQGGRFTAMVARAHAAHTEYVAEPGRWTFTHTKVDRDYEGQGVGSTLITEALGTARTRGVRVVPRCPFVAAFIHRHPEYRDLVERQDPPSV
jgi:uncharacterized protein